MDCLWAIALFFLTQKMKLSVQSSTVYLHCCWVLNKWFNDFQLAIGSTTVSYTLPFILFKWCLPVTEWFCTIRNLFQLWASYYENTVSFRKHLFIAVEIYCTSFITGSLYARIKCMPPLNGFERWFVGQSTTWSALICTYSVVCRPRSWVLHFISNATEWNVEFVQNEMELKKLRAAEELSHSTLARVQPKRNDDLVRSAHTVLP